MNVFTKTPDQIPNFSHSHQWQPTTMQGTVPSTGSSTEVQEAIGFKQTHPAGGCRPGGLLCSDLASLSPHFLTNPQWCSVFPEQVALFRGCIITFCGINVMMAEALGKTPCPLTRYQQKTMFSSRENNTRQHIARVMLSFGSLGCSVKTEKIDWCLQFDLRSKNTFCPQDTGGRPQHILSTVK